MRAVVVTEYGGPEVLTVIEVPDPVPGPDEILVKVAHSACNRADTLQRMGGYRDPVTRRHEILGLEYAGTVAAVGERVTLWSVGDRVMGIESGACYAELVATHERQALPIPSTVELSDAAAIPEVFLTAWDALVVQGGLTSGRWALVHAGAIRCGHGGDPDRQGDRCPYRRHLLGRQDPGMPRSGCRPGARTVAGRLGGSAARGGAGRCRCDPRCDRGRRDQPQSRPRSSRRVRSSRSD